MNTNTQKINTNNAYIVRETQREMTIDELIMLKNAGVKLSLHARIMIDNHNNINNAIVVEMK